MTSVYKRKTRSGAPSKKWTALWFDHELQKWRTTTAYAEKSSSLEKAKRLERRSALSAEGLIDPLLERASTPIGELLDDFMLTEIDSARSKRYRQQVRSRLERIILGVGAARIQDFNTVQVARFLESIQVNGKSLAPSSRSDYIITLKRFTQWAVTAKLIPNDPIATLKSPGRPEELAVHPRRSLTDEEMARLLNAAAKRPQRELFAKRERIATPTTRFCPLAVKHAIAKGKERRLVYLTVRWTALRRSEVRSLTWGNVQLDTKVPHIRLSARQTKNKKVGAIVLHPQIVEELKAHRPREVDPKSRVFEVIPDMKSLKADLKLAGIDYGNPTSGYTDFHAIGRVTSNTNLAIAGVTQRSRQAHMRHSHPALTECVYTDEKLLPIAEEIGRVPAI